MQRTTCCRIFTPALPEYPAASVRDYCSGAYSFIGSVLQGAATLIVLFVRFPITMSVIAFVGWLWFSGNLVLPH